MSAQPPGTTYITSHPSVKTIVCAGSPYEMGLTHGRAAAQEVHHNVRFYGQLFAETANTSWSQARKRAVAEYEPALREMWPEILEEMAGIAEGAGGGLTCEDVLTLNVRTEIVFGCVADGCSSMSRKGSGEDGGSSTQLFLAQNWDWLPELQQGMVFLQLAPKGTEVVLRFLGEAGIVGKIGMNSAGLGLLMNAIRSTASDKSKMPVHVMSRKLLQEARSVDDALQLLERYGVANSISYLLGDSSGRHADVEASPLGHSFIEPTVDGYIAHTNHLCASSQRPAGLVDTPTPDSMTRLARLRELTERDIARGVTASFEALRARLADQQGLPTAICRETPVGAVGLGRLTTLFTIVMDLRDRTGWAVIGRACDPELPVVKWSL